MQGTCPCCWWCVSLDVSEQETLLSGIFHSRAVAYRASCFGDEVQEKAEGKEREGSPLDIAKTPGSSWPVLLASPVFHRHVEDLR